MSVQELLKLENISKSFGVVKALKDITFSINKGEIHTISGENGAGKSTLVKIIKGELKPDSGKLTFEGNEVKTFDPLYANSIGISMVHQELSNFPNLSVAENIFVNDTFKTRIGLIDSKKMLKRSSEELALFDLKINPADKLMNIPLAEQRIIEILRAISLKKKLIILDEPTSGLNQKEVDKLLSILEILKNEGATILYISHRLSEVLKISDRITILKDGTYVSTLKNENIKEYELIKLMVGRDVNLYTKKVTDKRIKEEVFLEVKNLSKTNLIEDINFKLYKKEILGIFGLHGSGIEKLSFVMFGLESFDNGTISINKIDYKQVNTIKEIESGIIYLYKDRKIGGLFFDMSVMDNVACPILKKFSKYNIIKSGEISKYSEKFVKQFDIVLPDIQTRPKNLSGGNQQKLMFSICMGTNPKCIIVNEPTRGIDVGVKAEIHKVILDLPDKNTSVLIFSSDIPELIRLCDRVLIMRDKTIIKELTGNDINEEKILEIAAGTKVEIN